MAKFFIHRPIFGNVTLHPKSALERFDNSEIAAALKNFSQT